LQADGGNTVNLLGNGRQQVTPIYVKDVAAFLEAALTRGNPGVYPLAGPESMSMNELARLVNPAGCRLRHLPAFVARLLSYVVPSLPRPLVDVLVDDCQSDPARAQSEFGHEPRALTEIWGNFRVAGEKQKIKS
jgi:nucleoside-diphosphate-sugar epimerase